MILLSDTDNVKQLERKMSDRITYVMFRIDEGVKDHSKTIQKMVQAADEGVQHYQQQTITVKAEADVGGPVIYFP